MLYILEGLTANINEVEDRCKIDFNEKYDGLRLLQIEDTLILGKVLYSINGGFKTLDPASSYLTSKEAITLVKKFNKLTGFDLERVDIEFIIIED